MVDMVRIKKDPAKKFEFVNNPDKTLARSTMANYKRALNHITETSILEHEQDEKNPVIKTRQDLLDHPEHVLHLIKDHTSHRADKCASMAGIFYMIGRQDENHVYVTAFKDLYYKKNES